MPGFTMPNIQVPNIMNNVLIGLIIVLVIAIIGFLLWKYIGNKRYNQYAVRVLDKDSNGKAYEWPDKAGVFLDKKTGNRLLFLQKAKVGMNPNSIPYITRLDKKGRAIKIVTVRRTGVNNYVYVKIEIGENVDFTVGEEDLNNAHQEMVKIRKMTEKDNLLSKLMPIIVVVICMIVFMIVSITLFNKFTILQDVMNSAERISTSQLQITGLLLNITTSPQLNTNIPVIVGGQSKPGG